jgi:hypothetical protein
MSLSSQLAQELKLLIGQPSHDAPRSLVVPATHGKFTCELLAVDQLACSVAGLTFATGRLATASTAALKQLGSALSRKLTYLLEPISSLELDAEGVVLQMRSNPPRTDAHGFEFYEILVRQSGLRLARFRKLRGGTQREVIPATLTHEVLQRLATDMEQAVEQFYSTDE